MAKVIGMELHKTKPISFASADPIRDLLKALLDEAAGRRRYLGRKVSAQALLNGLILLLGDADRDERTLLVDRALSLIGNAELGELSDEDVAGMVKPLDDPPPAKPKGRAR